MAPVKSLGLCWSLQEWRTDWCLSELGVGLIPLEGMCLEVGAVWSLLLAAPHHTCFWASVVSVDESYVAAIPATGICSGIWSGPLGVTNPSASLQVSGPTVTTAESTPRLGASSCWAEGKGPRAWGLFPGALSLSPGPCICSVLGADYAPSRALPVSASQA